MTHTVAIDVPEDADVEQAGQSIEIEVDESHSILSAAREQGLWLPADCQQGWCTTCAARLVDGDPGTDVDQSDARRYFEEDVEDDFILPCTAFPEDDLHIEGWKHDEILDHRSEHDLPPGNAKR